MKARFFLCCGLSALFFGACSEDTTTDATPRPNGPGLVFTGITEGGRTRTQLGDKDKNGIRKKLPLPKTELNCLMLLCMKAVLI